jgi:hypothetical protein
VAGAAIAGGGTVSVSNASGALRLIPRQSGQIQLQARKSGATPSDPVTVCVYRRARSECAAGGPAVRIAGIRPNEHFKTGPRRLHGTVGPDPAGITDVSLSLSRRLVGRCSYFNATKGSWQATSCTAKVPSFSIGAGSTWSYLLPARLPAGVYRLAVTASDGNGRKGSAAVDFRVLR